MPYIVAFLIFAVLSAASGYVSMACLKSTYSDGPDPRTAPNYSTVAGYTIGAVTLTCFIPFPAGYFAGLVAWAVAVYGYLNLPAGRATVLLGYLAVASIVTRLVVLGLLDVV